MAATGHKLRFAHFFVGAVMLASYVPSAGADQQGEVRSQLSDIASALTGSNPSDAMTPFSKSFRDFEKLRNYFTGLTSAFSIVNELDVLDEADTAKDIVATVHWSITLSNGPVSGNSTQRAADIHVRFVRERGKWKIVEFSPIDIFDPAVSTWSSTPHPEVSVWGLSSACQNRSCERESRELIRPGP